MSKKKLTIFMLTMMNVAAIGSVKNWPTIAECGFSSLFFLLLATLCFFIPTAMVSAELATGWPKIGGVYIWVKEAFGHRAGFLAIWLQWVQTVIWYPTSLSFIAGTLAYLFHPEFLNNKFYMLTFILSVFWIITLINLKGIRESGWISSVGVIAGNFLPGLVIIVLGLLWYFKGNPLEITMNLENFVPSLSTPKNIVFFSGVILSLCGMEMTAVHAKDVENSQKNYPRAILTSTLIIFGMSTLGVLAIAFILPQSEISLTAGTMQAISKFFETYGLTRWVPLVAILIVVGAIASLSTWIVGPSRGLLAAAEGGDLPPTLRKINKNNMPIALLIGQAIVMTALSLLFVFMPSFDSAYWILTVLVAQAYLIMYLLMFSAAIYLRYKHPRVKRSYRVPGGNIGMWVISGVGILTSLFSIIIGFFPPSFIATGNASFYVLFLGIGTVVVILAPTVILWFKKPSWNHKLPHEGHDSGERSD